MSIAQLYLDLQTKLILEEQRLKNQLLDMRKNNKNDYFGKPGAKLVQNLTKIGAAIVVQTKKIKQEYKREVARYKSQEEMDQRNRFRSVKEIKKGGDQIATVAETIATLMVLEGDQSNKKDFIDRVHSHLKKSGHPNVKREELEELVEELSH